MYLPIYEDMIDKEFRNLKRNYLEPLAQNISIDPMVITILGFVLGIASLIVFYLELTFLALVLWLASRTCDGLDGLIARSSNKKSDSGGYTDLVVDFVLYAALPLVVALKVGGTLPLLAVALLFGVFYLNAAVWMTASAIYEKRKAQQGDTSIIMPRNLVEGFETIIFTCLMLIIPHQIAFLAFLMAALTFLGAIIGFFRSYRAFKG